MRISRLDVDDRGVVILGAGASRGASFVQKKPPTVVLPPLDRDFFDQVAALQDAKRTDDVETILAFAFEEFGAAAPSMEVFFTHVEFLHKLETQLKFRKGRKKEVYKRTIEAFKRVLASLLAQALGNESCDHHEALVGALLAGDSVISFNYDCLVDIALKKKGGRRWDPSKGYGVAVDTGPEYWAPTSIGQGKRPKEPIMLYKMHGSLNWVWDPKSGELKLREWPTGDPGGSLDFEIIPPAWSKPVTEHDLFREIWKGARKALDRAKVIVVIGYSAPNNDQLSQALLRSCSDKATPLEYLVVVNRNQEAQSRVIQLLEGAVTRDTRVRRFGPFEEFIPFLR